MCPRGRCLEWVALRVVICHDWRQSDAAAVENPSEPQFFCIFSTVHCAASITIPPKMTFRIRKCSRQSSRKCKETCCLNLLLCLNNRSKSTLFLPERSNVVFTQETHRSVRGTFLAFPKKVDANRESIRGAMTLHDNSPFNE